MSDHVPFVRGVGWEQNGSPVLVPDSVSNELKSEINVLQQEVTDEQNGVYGNYVGDGGAIYQTVLDWLNTNTVPQQGANNAVYTWINGAIGVNNDSSFQGLFIQDYTEDGYAIRMGGSSSNPAVANSAQLSSNQIALNVAIDIVENNDLPDIEGLGVLDAGAAAQTVFVGNPVLGSGDYAGWAGTLLFPYLGEQNLYNDFLLDPSQLIMAAPTGSVVAQSTSTVTYKHVAGAYDLFASIEATRQAMSETAGQTVLGQASTIFSAIATFAGGVSGVPVPDQNGTINQTNNWVKAYYSLSGKGLEFLPGHDLIFAAHTIASINYDVGTLDQNNINLSNQDNIRPTVIIGGPNNDTILGTAAGDDLIDGGDGNNTIFAGAGNDTIFGGGQGNNLIVGNIQSGAKTTDLLVGGGGNSTAANKTLGITDYYSTKIGSDTIVSGNGNNVIIGMKGNNTFNINNIDNNTINSDVNIIWGNGGQSTYNLSNAAASGIIKIVYLQDPTAAEIASLDPSSFASGGNFQSGQNQTTTIIVNPGSSDTLNIDGTSISSIVGDYSNWELHHIALLTDAQANAAPGQPSGGMHISPNIGYGPDIPSTAASDISFYGYNPLLPIANDATYNPQSNPLYFQIDGVTDGVFGIHVSPKGGSDFPLLGTQENVVDASSSPGTVVPYQGSGALSGIDGTVYSLAANQGSETVDNSISADASSGGTIAFGVGVQASDVAISATGAGNDVTLTGDGTTVVLHGELGSASTAPITAITFLDGTTLSYGNILAAVETPSTTNKAIYGDASSNVLNGRGIATYAQGGGGSDTFVFSQGYGQLEINESDAATNPSNVLTLGSGITSGQLVMTYDASGNLYLTDGMAGDQIKIDQQLNGPSFGVQSILFADGTTLTTAGLDPTKLTLQGNTGTAGADMLYGVANADTFDGKGAPAGSQDYEQGSGGADTFVFNQGYGHLEINESSVGTAASVLQFGSGITAAQVQVTADSSGAAYLTDGAAGDQVKLDNYLSGPSSGPQTISFADGSSLTQAQVIAQATTGTTGADSLYGSTGVDLFDGKGVPTASAGSSFNPFGPASPPLQDYEQGNGGNDTFVYDQGYGQLEISEVGSSGDASVLQFGPGITAGQVQVTTDGSGNVVLTDGTSGDQVTLDGYMNGSIYGPQTVAFADGTSWTQSEILAQLTTGTSNADVLYGTSGADVFDGKGAPLGSSFNPFGPVAPTPQDYEQGNGGADTFIYNQGYGQLEVNAYTSSGDASVLQLGSGITGAQMQVTTDNAGNVYLSDGTAGDQIRLDKYLLGASYGPQTISFADGTSWTQAQVLAQATTGTAGADTLYGTSGADTFDGKGAPAGSQDYEQGNGGADTFIYNQGYGQLEISEQAATNDASVLQLGSGITAAQIQVTADSSGDVTLSDGTSGDGVKLDGFLNGSSHGPQTISFADGTLWSRAQIIAQTTAGTPGADTLYGSAGAEVFDGQGAPAGSQDYEQGNGGADTFIYSQGYGHLEINELGASSDASVLQFGPGISPSQVQITTGFPANNIMLSDGIAGDQIQIDSFRTSSSYGPQTVSFSDGTIWTRAQIALWLTTGTAGADTITGTSAADVIDGKGAPTGAQDYEQGNGGADTFIYNPGYGQLEINELGSSSTASVLQLGPGITAAQVQVVADRYGDLLLTDGVAGDQIKIDGDLENNGYGVTNISFADGTVWGNAQVVAQENVGTLGADNLFGTSGADVLDGKGAPAGAQDYAQGNGGADTFIYDQGYGQLEISERGSSSDASVLQLGSGITAAQVQVTTDSSGDLILSDGTAGDQIKLDSYLNDPSYGPQTISFADGSSWSRAQALAQTTIGTAGADALYGTSNADTFDGRGAPPGSRDYEQGNGGADTFIYNQGYGQLEINEATGYADTTATLQLGAGISVSQLSAASDTSGNVILSDGVPGDQIKIDNMLNFGYNGAAQYGVAQVQLSNGTIVTRQQILALLTTGSAAADQLYGTSGADTFDGKGAPTGSQDYEQGNGGADTFVYNQGYGALEINESAGYNNTSAVLQLGAGITQAQLTATSDASGNLTLSDGTTGDQVTIDKMMNVTYYGTAEYGVAQIQFADGSTLTSQQLRTLATTGTPGANILYGSAGTETFDGHGAPAGAQDYEQGNDGNDTFVYNQGYGQLEINEEGYSISGSVLQLGVGITSSQLHVREDNGGNVVLTDGVANDQITLDGYLNGSFYNSTGPQTISFADGTSWTQAQLIAQAISQTSTIGTTGADILYGTINADTFDGQGAPAGSQDYEQGNGGADIFIYNQGYGQLEISEDAGSYTNSTGVLQLGPGITSAQITVTSDVSGDLTLFDGTTGDRVTIDQMMNVGYYDTTEYGVAQIQFADGSTLTNQQLKTMATTGTAGADVLYGSDGTDTFDGQGAPVGSQDYEQGNGGADTFLYNAGYGQLEINEDAGSYRDATAVLQLGSNITPAQVTASADGSGNFILTDGLNGDQIKIDGMMKLGYGGHSEFGVAQLQFADGTSWTQSQLTFLASTGTGGADTITGTSDNDIIDGRGGTDMVSGNGGYDTYLFRQGYGALTIDNSSAAGTGPQGEVAFGSGITEQNLWFAQSGNDLLAKVLGSQDVLDIKGWFSSDPTAQLAEIKAFDGMKLDTQVPQLVAAMASYQSSNPGFDPTAATSMPNDPTLRAALASAWHN